MIVLPFSPVGGLGTIFYMVMLFAASIKPPSQKIYIAQGYLGLCWSGSNYPKYCLFNWSLNSKYDNNSPLILNTSDELLVKYFYPFNKNPVIIKISGFIFKTNKTTEIRGKIIAISIKKPNCTKITRALEISKSYIKTINIPVCKPHIGVWLKNPKWINGTFNETCELVNFSIVKTNNHKLYVLSYNCTLNTTNHSIKMLEIEFGNILWLWHTLIYHTKVQLHNAKLKLLYVGNDTYIDIPYFTNNTGGEFALNTSQVVIAIINQSKLTSLLVLKERLNNTNISITPKIIQTINGKLSIKYYKFVPLNIPYKNVLLVVGRVNKDSILFFGFNNNISYEISLLNKTTNNLYIKGLPIYYKDKSLFLPKGINENVFVMYLNNKSTIITAGY